MPVFEEEEQFTEDLGQVRTVDLIDNQYKRLVVWVIGRFFGEPLEGSGLELKFAIFGRSPSFNKVLVGVRGMELDKLDSIFGPGKPFSELACYPGLSRSWWPVEDRLGPVVEQRDDLLEFTCWLQVEALGELKVTMSRSDASRLNSAHCSGVTS